jgi:hypothetical protein
MERMRESNRSMRILFLGLWEIRKLGRLPKKPLAVFTKQRRFLLNVLKKSKCTLQTNLHVLLNYDHIHSHQNILFLHESKVSAGIIL